MPLHDSRSLTVRALKYFSGLLKTATLDPAAQLSACEALKSAAGHLFDRFDAMLRSPYRQLAQQKLVLRASPVNDGRLLNVVSLGHEDSHLIGKMAKDAIKMLRAGSRPDVEKLTPS